MTLREMQNRYLAGEPVVRVDEAEPWTLLHCSRSTFYRSMAAGEVPGVLHLGRRRLLQLPTFLAWLGALPTEQPGGVHHDEAH